MQQCTSPLPRPGKVLLTASSPAAGPTGGLLSSFSHDEARLRGLVTAVSQVVWRCDANGAAIDSTGWSGITGEPDADALGHGWLKCVHPDDATSARDGWLRAVSTLAFYHGEFRIRTTNGEYRWYRAHGIQVTDPGNGEREWLGVTWDVHEQHVAQDSLRKQNERLQAVIRTQQDIAQAGMDGLEIMRRVASQVRDLVRADAAAVVIAASPDTMECPVIIGDVYVEAPLRMPSGESLAGWCYGNRQSALCGDTLHDPRVSRPVQLAMGMRSSIVVPLLYRDDCQGVLTVLSRTVNFFDNEDHQTVELLAGILASALAISVDASERRLLEDQLRQAQKMDAVGQLAGGVAHDFNNILTAITSYSDMLLTDLAPGHPARADVGEIRTAARRAAELTRQLLAFSRKQVMELEIFDATQVVTQMDRMLRRLIGENIVLETAYPDRSLPVRADRVHLEQVVMNLVVNAKDAMPAGGKLRITLEATEPNDQMPPGTRLLLRVKDNGCGMSAAVRARVFEPFFTTKPYGKGTGLGLAVVYGIVQQFGGQITVSSEEGAGSEFTIQLPLARGSLRAPVCQARAAAGGTEVILLVEDNPTVAQVARRVLERDGYHVLLAQNGAEALGIVAGHKTPIDLVLTDVVMPEISGPELVARLASEGLRVPVVFMSGYAENTVLRREELPAGALYLEKPWTPESLNRTVRAALDS